MALHHLTHIDATSVEVSNSPAAHLPGQIEDQIDLMLALTGRASGADRVCILTLETPRMERIWCATGVPLPAGWPDSYEAQLPSYLAIPSRSFRMYASDPSVPPEFAEKLRSEGMLALSCAKLLQDENVIGFVCFERSKPFPHWLKEDGVVLDVIGDVIAGALRQRDAVRRQREAEAKLRRAERLRSIGMFTSGIAHNFNNLLMVIGGQAEMAAGLFEPSSPAARHVEQIADAVRRGRTIVADILDYGRSEPKVPHSVELPALVRESIANLETLGEPSRPRIQLRTDVADAYVLADAGQLHQVFLNVIQNAMQASADDAEIVVGLDVLRSASRRLSHGTLKPGSFVRVSVSDTGRGMDPAQQARMFQPFFTTRGSGTGLGLATAFQTVVEIGGAFDVSSVPGAGTTVEIWLPASDYGRVKQAVGGTVLLLGHDRREILRDEDLLAALGFEPVGFIDPDTALAAIGADMHRFDIVILDQVVVEQHGDVVGRVRGLTGTGKPIVLSLSDRDAETPPSIPMDGIAAILKRPWRPTAILTALSEVLPG